MSDLVIEDLVKRFGQVTAVDGISLTVASGQLTTLLGPSGCGKTTTLNCIAGLERPDAGLIRVGDFVLTDIGRNLALPPEARQLGMVFQSYALWPHMTVEANLEFGLKLRRVPADERRRRIREVLELVGLGGMEKRYPFQLSGGQQQRVALARAVVTQPRLLLLDEPLSNLDAKVREQARFWLRDFQKRLGITTVYVTHDQAEALAISDMVAVMSNGRLLQYAPPPEIYERPASRFVADFIGVTSFLEGVVAERADSWAQVRLDNGALLKGTVRAAVAEGQQVSLAIRSERIRVHPVNDTSPAAANTLDGRIVSSVYQGSKWQHLVETAVGTLRVETIDAVPSSEVRLELAPDDLMILPPE